MLDLVAQAREGRDIVGDYLEEPDCPGDSFQAALLLAADLPRGCADGRAEAADALDTAHEILRERWPSVEELAERVALTRFGGDVVGDCAEQPRGGCARRQPVVDDQSDVFGEAL